MISFLKLLIDNKGFSFCLLYMPHEGFALLGAGADFKEKQLQFIALGYGITFCFKEGVSFSVGKLAAFWTKGKSEE